jgi:hypothetical protein
VLLLLGFFPTRCTSTERPSKTSKRPSWLVGEIQPKRGLSLPASKRRFNFPISRRHRRPLVLWASRKRRVQRTRHRQNRRGVEFGRSRLLLSRSGRRARLRHGVALSASRSVDITRRTPAHTGNHRLTETQAKRQPARRINRLNRAQIKRARPGRHPRRTARS